MSRAQKFIDMCINLPFEELRDERDETTIPELLHVAEMRDAGNMQDAIDYGRALTKMYPDFDLIPFMIAYIYYQKDFSQEALQTAIEAVPRCPRKYRLYAVAGLAEFRRGHLPEAFVWFSRSAVAQCKIQDFQESDPFLYLANAAEILGARREAEMLFQMVEAIERQKPPHLNPADIDLLIELRESWAREPLLQVLRTIDSQYLHAG